MVYVVKKGYDELGGLMQEYWRGDGPLMSSSKKASEIWEAKRSGRREAICIGLAEMLTARRIKMYEHIGDMWPKIEWWDVQKLMEEFDKNWPPATDKREEFLDNLYANLMKLVEDEHLEKRNTENRRAKVVTGEIEANDEDKAYFAERARELAQEAERLGRLGGQKLEYLVKGGITEIDV